MMRSLAPIDKKDTPPYTRMALSSPYNVFLIILLAVPALLSGELWLCAVALGVELGWLLLAPRVRPLRSAFDRAFDEERRRRDTEAMLATIHQLGDEDRRRVADLDRLRTQIRDACRWNEMLQKVAGDSELELERLDRLIRAFVKVAARAARYERYIESADLSALEGDVKRQQTIVDRTTDPEAKALFERNLALLGRRLDKAHAVRRRVRVARGQLQLIENTIRLFHDQLMTIESPEAFSDQLEDLVSSIDVIESSGRDMEALMRQLEAGETGETTPAAVD